MPKHKLFVNGKWIEGSAEAHLPVINPATEEKIAEVSEASVADTQDAIGAARRAFDGGPWSRMTPKERSLILRRAAEIMCRRKDELVDLMVAEAGTPRMFADLVQVTIPIRQFEWWANQAEAFEFLERLSPVPGMGGMGEGVIVKEPVGVVAALTGFNAPFFLNVFKVGPALAMGNTVVLKPSPLTPLSALVLAEILEEAELPPGALNVVLGGSDVGEQLTTSSEVDLVSFTGSDATGRKIYAQAAPTLKKVILELGGKSANIIFAGVDLDAVVFASMMGFTLLCGQGCALTTRLLVQRSIHDEVVERLGQALAMINVGDPADPAVTMGPLISAAQRDRVERHVALGKEEGARVVHGGGRPGGLDKGFFFEPTLITHVDNGMTIAQEEIFGPVGVVIPFDNAEEAVRLANESRYGLAGAVWAAEDEFAVDVAKQIRAGTLTANGAGGVMVHPDGPFGGYKSSGIGRELGKYGLLEYVELKTVLWPASS